MTASTRTVLVTTDPPTAADRSMDRSYSLPDHAGTDSHGRPTVPQLHVSVHHDRERKAFSFMVDRQLRIEYDGYSINQTVVHIGAGLDPRIKGLWFRESVARYSRPALVTAFQEYVRDFIEPNLDALLDYAADAATEH